MKQANAFDWMNYTEQERVRKGVKDPYKNVNHFDGISLGVTKARERTGNKGTIGLPNTRWDLQPKVFAVYSKAVPKK
jgi:hypothetical protein